MESNVRQGPLAGLKVVELNAIGPVPMAAGLLADLGADVLRIEAPGPGFDAVDVEKAVHLRGRSSARVNLRDPESASVVRDLVARADVLLEGFRPGVLEKLGFAPDDLLADNPALVIGRMTGWGQDGPLAQRAGHDMNYIAVAGPLRHFARQGERPVPPVNLVADFGGGAMFLLLGVLSALFERSRSGRGQVIDAAMVDGSAYLMMLVYSLAAQGLWNPDAPGTNLLDTGAPFYDVYRCADGEFLSVGCLEPKFYSEFLEVLGLDDTELPNQFDVARWPELRTAFTDIIATRTRDAWDDAFRGTDACTFGVRSMVEASEDPHLKARGTFLPDEPLQPAPAPRFSRTPGQAVPRSEFGHGAAALEAWGVPAELAERTALPHS
ncbi:MAG: CaiB/BaiF CoA-transferase family protein [Candidatus Nanopelagicales bacterium]